MSNLRAAHFRVPNKENGRRIGRKDARFPIKDSVQRRRREEEIREHNPANDRRQFKERKKGRKETTVRGCFECRQSVENESERSTGQGGARDELKRGRTS